MKRFIAGVFAVLVFAASPAIAVSDPLVPGDNGECVAANSQAAGHPAFTHQQPQGANPPFSLNNPGASTGAKGSANSEAAEHRQNAQ